MPPNGGDTMSALFEELDYQVTDLGAISLRRRHSAQHGTDIYEVKLGEDFLMSSLFTASEIALAELGLKACVGDDLDIVVGGLGLGYTAGAALHEKRVASVTVVEALQPVINWHCKKLVPLDPPLVDDPRCHFRLGDFFSLAASDKGFDATDPGHRYDAILVDIDHTPDMLLSANNASFYQPEGLAQLVQHLKPGGVFGLWSNLPPDPEFTARLNDVFSKAWAETVTFHNPIQDRDISQAVYLAQTATTHV